MHPASRTVQASNDSITALIFFINITIPSNFRFIVPFRRTCAAFLPVVSGTVGKGLERETLCPFPRLRRFGTHYETGSKFLLLFSIKSKEESPCFAEKVPNGRTTNLVQEIFCATALNQCEALLFFARLRPIGACAANSPLLKSPSSSTLSAFSANPPTAPSPAPHPPA